MVALAIEWHHRKPPHHHETPFLLAVSQNQFRLQKMVETGPLPIDVHHILDTLFRLCVVGILGYLRQFFTKVSSHL